MATERRTGSTLYQEPADIAMLKREIEVQEKRNKALKE
jgi:hypothetical protein